SGNLARSPDDDGRHRGLLGELETSTNVRLQECLPPGCGEQERPDRLCQTRRKGAGRRLRVELRVGDGGLGLGAKLRKLRIEAAQMEVAERIVLGRRWILDAGKMGKREVQHPGRQAMSEDRQDQR